MVVCCLCIDFRPSESVERGTQLAGLGDARRGVGLRTSMGIGVLIDLGFVEIVVVDSDTLTYLF